MKKLFLTVALAMTANVQAADLIEVYRDAAAYDATFASARSALEAGREKLPQGRAGLLPTLGLSANTVWNDIEYQSRPTTGVIPAQYNSSGWGISLTQPLFRWQNWASFQQSELAVVQAETQYLAAKQDLALRVAQAYFDVLLAQETLTTARAQKSAIAEQLASAKRNFEVGTATITDTHEAQARFDLTNAQEIAAANDLLVKRHALQTLTGKEGQGLKTLKSGLEIKRPQPDDMAQWVAASEQGNPAVAASQASYEIADREVSKQRGGHLPTLDLVASRSRASMQTTLALGVARPGSDTDATTIGLQLAVPLFAGGGQASRDREAVALRDKARSDLDNARRQAALQARQAYLGVTSGLAQVKALEQGLVSSRSALDSNRLGYEVGVRINIDVLNAQQQVYSTQRDLAKARLDTLTAQLRLKAAAGTLVEDDLLAVNALLE